MEVKNGDPDGPGVLQDEDLHEFFVPSKWAIASTSMMFGTTSNIQYNAYTCVYIYMQQIYIYTLPETNIAPENWWLEY